MLGGIASCPTFSFKAFAVAARVITATVSLLQWVSNP